MTTLEKIAEYRKQKPLRQGIEHPLGVKLHDFIVEENIKTIVETGICHGFSSWYFLEALKVTGGELVSIEPKLQDEIVVPEDLRKSWRIIEGPSPPALISLLSAAKQIDFFWHDSKHDFATQLGEYAVASRHAKFIGSHDVYRTGAWIAFLDLYGWKEIMRGHKYAVARRV